jgi:hypothetical protein
VKSYVIHYTESINVHFLRDLIIDQFRSEIVQCSSKTSIFILINPSTQSKVSDFHRSISSYLIINKVNNNTSINWMNSKLVQQTKRGNNTQFVERTVYFETICRVKVGMSVCMCVCVCVCEKNKVRTRRLLGFKSRWRIPCLWSQFIPNVMSLAINIFLQQQ